VCGTTLLLTTQHISCILLFGDEPRVQAKLQKHGCSFEYGHGGHLIVRLGARMSVLPMHGKGKELGTGLVNRIKKDLGLG
jgi:mRNA interferase HicA